MSGFERNGIDIHILLRSVMLIFFHLESSPDMREQDGYCSASVPASSSMARPAPFFLQTWKFSSFEYAQVLPAVI